MKASPRTTGAKGSDRGRWWWPVAVAGGGTRRALPQAPGPTPYAARPTRTLPAAPRGPRKTRHVSAAQRMPLPALALALDPSVPDLTSNTQEGNFRNSGESRTCPQKDPTSSKLNFDATGETFTKSSVGITCVEHEPAAWSARWGSAVGFHASTSLTPAAARQRHFHQVRPCLSC